MTKVDEDSRGLPISETLFLGSCSSCLDSQKCKCFFSACAVISAFSRWIVAWILHLHACFTPTGVRKPWFDMVWLMMHDVIHCNPGSIWCCWNRVGFCVNLLLIRLEHYWNIRCKLQIWHPPTGSAPLESFKSDQICKLHPALPSRLWPHSPPFHIQIWPSHPQC